MELPALDPHRIQFIVADSKTRLKGALVKTRTAP
jgi:hypothetical protein